MRSLWRRFIMLIDGWLYRAEVALNTAHNIATTDHVARTLDKHRASLDARLSERATAIEQQIRAQDTRLSEQSAEHARAVAEVSALLNAPEEDGGTANDIAELRLVFQRTVKYALAAYFALVAALIYHCVTAAH